MSDSARRPGQLDNRSKIIDVAARLLREEGPAAVTTRAVAQGAGVQAPTIYRLFGDKDGLLEAVAEHVMATFVASKAAVVEAASADEVDPLDDLRAGWQSQIDFGVANPSLFRLLSDPHRVLGSPAALSGKRVLEARVRRVALAGRLRVTEERAVGLIQAAGTGAIQVLVTTPPAERDPGLADALFEAVLAKILTEASPNSDALESAADAPRSAAVTFRALAPQLEVLTAAERALLVDWLDRVVDAL